MLLEDFDTVSGGSKKEICRGPLMRVLLLLTFIMPVAGVSLLQVDRSTSGSTLILDDFSDTKESVELLRFVTGYKVPMEAEVDITAYSQLLEALLSEESVEFYIAIDTWVSNDTRKRVLYLSNTSDRCASVWSSQGNAWNVSLDLVTWPKTHAEAIHPKSSILLEESFPNPLLNIGKVSAYEGTRKGSEVNLSESVALHSPSILLVVFSCFS